MRELDARDPHRRDPDPRNQDPRNLAASMHARRLPQLDGRLWLTDGGIETTLIFHEGWNLPMFQAFTLLEGDAGRAALRAYYERYVSMAVRDGTGFVLETPTWRANPDWGERTGYGREALARINRAAVDLVAGIRDGHETEHSPMIISGCVGPRGDGYNPGTLMSAEEAQRYHGWQIGIFRDAGADLVSALTLTNVNEGLGIARAGQAAAMPCVISFTLETDGRLPSGEELPEAIEHIDTLTHKGPAYYMINCAHPTHFEHLLRDGAPWTRRLGGLRANASRRSHAELDNSPDLDIGDPAELGVQYRDLRRRFPHLNVMGGCCGTDHRHLECISLACKAVS